MKTQLNHLLDGIEKEFRKKIQKGARHYLEVNVGKRAKRLGYENLERKFKNTCVIVPIKEPEKGMKVRIDGRTFVGYAEFSSGIAVPGFLARETGKYYQVFVPQDSMICNFA